MNVVGVSFANKVHTTDKAWKQINNEKKHVKLEHIAKGTSDVTNGSAGDAGGGPRASSEKASPAAKRIAGRKKSKTSTAKQATSKKQKT